ncbi:MAG: low molecular weight phosphatase family protein [Variibacter sp.]
MDAPAPRRKPQAILFACGWNAVRSPMAAALLRHVLGRSTYVESVGVRKGDPDPFAAAVLDEIGIDIGKKRPQTFEELEEYEGLNFDLIISLSPEAHHKALDLTRTLAADVEYWPTPDVTGTTGNREQVMDAYRAVRDMLLTRIHERFGAQVHGSL